MWFETDLCTASPVQHLSMVSLRTLFAARRPASAPGSAVERPAQRTPGHATEAPPDQPGFRLRARAARGLCARPGRPASPPDLRGDGCAACDEDCLAEPATAQRG
jgi:hypothetical protein